MFFTPPPVSALDGLGLALEDDDDEGVEGARYVAATVRGKRFRIARAAARFVLARDEAVGAGGGSVFPGKRVVRRARRAEGRWVGEREGVRMWWARSLVW